MRTPQGGQRDTIWVLQYRMPPIEEGRVTTWNRYEPGSNRPVTGPQAKALLEQLRADEPGFEWRAIRVETVQRVEGW